MVTIDVIRKAVQQYNDTYRHPNLTPLALSGVYSLFPDATTTTQSPLKWDAIWPSSDKPGVYLIFDENMNLLYVGKASLRHNLGGRLSAYFQYAKDGSRACAVLGTWSRKPAFVVTIGVDKAFEAPSLEEYLITELQPPDNTRGVGKRIEGNVSGHG